MRRQLDLYSVPANQDRDAETDSDTGVENPRLDYSLPGSASGGRSASRPSGYSASRMSEARNSPGQQAPAAISDEEAGEPQALPPPPPPPHSRPFESRGRISTGSSGSKERSSTVPAPVKSSHQAAPQKALCCDKCDGPHLTDDCPHFRKPREKHADAWVSYGKKSSDEMQEEIHVIRSSNARVVRQPGDGSCLFHSLSYGLSDRSTSASSLRREICRYVESNPDAVIADTPIKDWVRYDSGGTVHSYAQHMSGSQWGGGIEMAALTKMKPVSVHVYEKCSEGFKRISKFDNPNAEKTISVLYQGRMHYDAIEVY